MCGVVLCEKVFRNKEYQFVADDEEEISRDIDIETLIYVHHLLTF